MTSPLVSVVMPVRNGALWLGEAIDSILGQTMRELELIVVDNGSTDETPQIIAGYAGRDRRLVGLGEAEPGAAAARNAGLARARGDWIASMDADDLARPGRLERQLALGSTQDHLSLIGSGFDEIDAAGRSLRFYSYPATDSRLRQRLLRLKGFFPASSAFFRRAAAQRLGGYRTAVGYAEDWDMWLRLAEAGRLACVPDALVAIRRHEGQVSRFEAGRPQAVHAMAATVAWFLRREGLEDPIAAGAGAGFVAWVGRGMDQDRYFEQRRAWQEARARALSGGNRPFGLARFGAEILASGHGPALLAHKLVGNDLARRLAAEWVRGTR